MTETRKWKDETRTFLRKHLTSPYTHLGLTEISSKHSLLFISAIIVSSFSAAISTSSGGPSSLMPPCLSVNSTWTCFWGVEAAVVRRNGVMEMEMRRNSSEETVISRSGGEEWHMQSIQLYPLHPSAPTPPNLTLTLGKSWVIWRMFAPLRPMMNLWSHVGASTSCCTTLLALAYTIVRAE